MATAIFLFHMLFSKTFICLSPLEPEHACDSLAYRVQQSWYYETSQTTSPWLMCMIVTWSPHAGAIMWRDPIKTDRDTYTTPAILESSQLRDRACEWVNFGWYQLQPLSCPSWQVVEQRASVPAGCCTNCRFMSKICIVIILRHQVLGSLVT